MFGQYNASIVHMLEDEINWRSLYETLKKAVSSWVYTHRVPSWVGQEDDIIEDVIQESLMRTLRHLREQERGQAAPVESLPQFSKTIAYNYCRDLRRRDCRLIPIRDSSWAYILVFEIAEDPQDIAVERAWQEEVFVCIASAINSFPAKQRHALLTDLACRMDFYDNPTPLQSAFLHEGIRLEQYRQLPSQDVGERNRYLSALSTARKRLKSIILAYEVNPELKQAMRRQRELPARKDVRREPEEVNAQISMFCLVSSSLGVENMSSQAIAQPKTSDTERTEAFVREITAMNKPAKEYSDSLEEQDAPMILDDPELARLALHLRQTPPPTIDPAYREALQAKLLETVLAQKQENVCDGLNEMGSEETKPETSSKQESQPTQNGETRQEESILPDESGTSGLYDDVELAVLACHLQKTASTGFDTIDPRFREALLEKLLEVVRRPPAPMGKRRSRRILTIRLGCLF